VQPLGDEICVYQTVAWNMYCSASNAVCSSVYEFCIFGLKITMLGQNVLPGYMCNIHCVFDSNELFLISNFCHVLNVACFSLVR
jgi:hypothetical protein